MTTLAYAVFRPRLSVSASALNIGLVLAGALLMTGLSQVAVPLPFTPVPITGQTLGVLLVGSGLGWKRGVASMLLFLSAGAVGLPVFAQGEGGIHVLLLGNATGGYLWGFAFAALVLGRIAERGWGRSLRSSIAAMLIGQIVIYLCGVPWLAATLGVSASRALELGLYPFVVGDVLKILVAATSLPLAWKLTEGSSVSETSWNGNNSR